MPIKRTGADWIQQIKGLPASVKEKIPGTLERIGVYGAGEMKRILSTPGRGRVYSRGRKEHIASAPGDPPAPDTGALRNSVQFEVDGNTVRIGPAGPGSDPAEVLEFGSLPRGRGVAAKAGRGALGSRLGGTAPRPFVRPTEASTRKQNAQFVADMLKEALPK